MGPARQGSLVMVDSIMSRRLVVVHPDATARDAATLMRDQRVGSLIVSSGAGATGIVTVGDLVHRVVAAGRDPAATRVREVMSSPVATLAPSATLEEAATTMKRLRIKRLVVVLDGHVRGIVTVRDIAYASPEAMRDLVEGWVKQRWQD